MKRRWENQICINVIHLLQQELYQIPTKQLDNMKMNACISGELDHEMNI